MALDVDFMQLDTIIRQKCAAGTDYSKVISTCLGIAVSRILPIPTAEIDNPEMHWASDMRYMSDRLIGMFNEQLIVDFDLASSTARSWWMIRHRAAHPLFSFNSAPGEDFANAYLCVTDYAAPEVLTMLNRHPQIYAGLVSRIGFLLKKKTDPLNKSTSNISDI